MPRIGHLSWPPPRSLTRALSGLAEARGRSVMSLLAELTVRPDEAVLDALVAAATVTHTRFFRHPEHFDRLAQWLAERTRARIWTVGCASGQEAYSLGLIAQEQRVEWSMLATDVNPEALRKASAGCYPTSPEGAPGPWAPPPEVRKRIRFGRASVVGGAPDLGEGPFDVIFCRNVLIYFPEDKQRVVVRLLRDRLRRGGVLVVAPVEALLRLPRGLRSGSPLGWLEVRGASQPSMPAIRQARSRPPTVPPSAVGLLDQASRALGEGDPDAAERHLRRSLQDDPGSAQAWFLLGEALERRRERAQARAAYARAAECAGPEDGYALLGACRRRVKALL